MPPCSNLSPWRIVVLFVVVSLPFLASLTRVNGEKEGKEDWSEEREFQSE